MLWELLTMIGATSFVWASIQTAREVHAGVGGYTTVIVLGLLMAAGYEVAAHKVAGAVVDHLKTRSESHQKWLLRGFYACSAVFPLVAAILGIFVSQKVLRLF
jgi:hypothetical protein